MGTFCDYEDGKACINRNEEPDHSCESNDFELFSEELTEAINDSSNDRLVSFLNCSRSMKIIKEFTYETLVSLISILESQEDEANVMINNSCDEALHFLSIHCQPNELLLYLVEQIELCNSDQFFYQLLKPLKICLTRCKNPSTVLDMCLDVVRKFVSHLTVPNCGEDDTYNDHIERIILSYTHISKFYEDLVSALDIKNQSSENRRKIQNVILESLLLMFGNPICHLNFSSSNHCLIISKILKSILQIQWDVIHLWKFINYGDLHKCGLKTYPQNFKTGKLDNEEHDTVLNVDDLSLCNFYWSVLCTETVHIPSVYNPYYIAYNVINMSNCLMNCQGNRKVLTVKALDLISFALKILNGFQLPLAALELSMHCELFRNLENCILYPDSEETQKYALKLFKDFTNVFEIGARFLVMKNLIVSDHHSKIKSIVIGIFKNNVAEILNMQETRHGVDRSLMYSYLKAFIPRICSLQDGVNINLIDISDQILVTLNFILFLAINGQRNTEISGIFSHSVMCFLTTLKTAISSQKGLCKLNLDELRSCGSVIKEKDDGSEMRVLLQDPNLSLEQKISLCNKAINSLFMMEDTLNRINECMTASPNKIL